MCFLAMMPVALWVGEAMPEIKCRDLNAATLQKHLFLFSLSSLCSLRDDLF